MIKCPKCGNEVKVIINGFDLINRCTVCDYEVSTTYNSPMDFDGTKYVISILAHNEISLDNIKLISKLTNSNFLQAKSCLEKGYMFDKEYAISILEKKKLLDKTNIRYQIAPNFQY